MVRKVVDWFFIALLPIVILAMLGLYFFINELALNELYKAAGVYKISASGLLVCIVAVLTECLLAIRFAWFFTPFHSGNGRVAALFIVSCSLLLVSTTFLAILEVHNYGY